MIDAFLTIGTKVCKGSLSDHEPGARLPISDFNKYTGALCRDCFNAWQTLRRRKRARGGSILWPAPPHRAYNGPVSPAGTRLKVQRVRGLE